jgi:NtrC-family two-component system sensor histidine kinase KinB
MTLKRRVLVGYGVAFVLMGMVIAWSVINLVSLGKASEAILSENYRSILAAEKMVNALERQDSGILLICSEDAEKGIQQFRKNEPVFFEWLARAKDNITIKGEEELVEKISSGYDKYRQQFSAWTDQQGGDKQEFSSLNYRESIYPLFVNVRDACISLRCLNEETMYAASDKAGTVARKAIWSTSLVAVISLLVAFIFSLFLAERLVRPIRQIMEASRKISSGDYLVQVPVETEDELGRLASEFNEMVKKLHHYHELNIEQIISEKNKGEAILSSIEDGLVVFDIDLKITGINPAAREILGVALFETVSLHCSDILSNTKVYNLITETVESGQHPNIPEEQRIDVFSSGKRSRHCLYSVTAIRGRDRKLTGIVLLLRDVTRLKEVEQIKSEFVMAASHELRTPLTSLGMSVDLLLENAGTSLSENDQELLEAAHEEIERMKALVNDLLDLSKIEAGKIDMEYDSVHVKTIFEHVSSIFKGQLKIKQVDLSFETAKDLPKVRADANKITWILTNLVSNALRYVDDGGHIQLKAHRIGPNVHLSIHDDGPGIPPEYQTKIFQKFVQVNDQAPGGTGLGLAICKEIVRAHGGTIWVESAKDSGTVFTFTLPVYELGGINE